MCIRSVQSQTDGCRLSAPASFCFCFSLFCFFALAFASALLWLSRCCSLRPLGLFCFLLCPLARSFASQCPALAVSCCFSGCLQCGTTACACRSGCPLSSRSCVSRLYLLAGHPLPSPAALGCTSGCLRDTCAPSVRTACTRRLVRSVGSCVQPSGDAVWFSHNNQASGPVNARSVRFSNQTPFVRPAVLVIHTLSCLKYPGTLHRQVLRIQRA